MPEPVNPYAKLIDALDNNPESFRTFFSDPHYYLTQPNGDAEQTWLYLQIGEWLWLFGVASATVCIKVNSSYFRELAKLPPDAVDAVRRWYRWKKKVKPLINQTILAIAARKQVWALTGDGSALTDDESQRHMQIEAKKLLEQRMWLNENVTGRYHVVEDGTSTFSILFADIKDAVHFKMRVT